MITPPVYTAEQASAAASTRRARSPCRIFGAWVPTATAMSAVDQAR